MHKKSLSFVIFSATAAIVESH